MKRSELLVSGHVQGVGFRNYCRKQASRHSLSGCVENLPDGAVRIEVQGSDEALESFIAAIRVGPKDAFVLNIEQRLLPVNEDESEFVIA